MKEIFKEILGINGVRGVMLCSFEGSILYKEFTAQVPVDPDTRDWGLFIDSMNGVREADFVFEDGRIYIRKSEAGYLMILMSLSVPVAMMRLNCDIILPSLKPVKSGKSLKRLFKR